MNGSTGMKKRTAAAEAALILAIDGTTEVVPFPGSFASSQQVAQSWESVTQ
jgi:hypothetical protein